MNMNNSTHVLKPEPKHTVFSGFGSLDRADTEHADAVISDVTVCLFALCTWSNMHVMIPPVPKRLHKEFNWNVVELRLTLFCLYQFTCSCDL